MITKNIKYGAPFVYLLFTQNIDVFLWIYLVIWNNQIKVNMCFGYMK